VRDTAVLGDRLEGGEARLALIGVRLHSFTTTRDLLGALGDSKLVAKSRVDAIFRRLGHVEARRK